MHFPESGVDYDFAEESIRCNADKAGAAVFELRRGTRTLRVLAFSELAAQQRLARITDEEMESRFGLLF